VRYLKSFTVVLLCYGISRGFFLSVVILMYHSIGVAERRGEVSLQPCSRNTSLPDAQKPHVEWLFSWRYIGAVGRASIYHIPVSREPEGTCTTDWRRNVMTFQPERRNVFFLLCHTFVGCRMQQHTDLRIANLI